MWWPLATLLVVGHIIQRRAPTEPNRFKLSRSEGPSGSFVRAPGHLGTSGGGNLLMPGARYGPASCNACGPLQRPCQSEIIIPFLRVRTEAQRG